MPVSHSTLSWCCHLPHLAFAQMASPLFNNGTDQDINYSAWKLDASGALRIVKETQSGNYFILILSHYITSIKVICGENVCDYWDERVIGTAAGGVGRWWRLFKLENAMWTQVTESLGRRNYFYTIKMRFVALVFQVLF